MSAFKIAVFEGDGIGPEIMKPTVDLLRRMSSVAKTYDLTFENLPGGAGCYMDMGESLPKTSLAVAGAADAILLSAMGLPDIRYPDGTEITPQIDLRMAFDLFAGIRPVRIPPGGLSPLKMPAGKSVDFVLVRESTEGLFYTQGKGKVEHDEARETLRITRGTSEKLFEFAFNLATDRKAQGQGTGRVTCVDKANVFRAFAFFREIFDKTAREHPAIEADHAYVDAMALWMVQRPWDFDVLVTENMFGDILSDLGAGLMGGLGVAPSADIGQDHAVFQPCHGSAPDIAGLGAANPFAMVLSAAMMLDWLGLRHNNTEMAKDAARLREAVDGQIIGRKALTGDIGGTARTDEAVAALTDALFAAA